MAQLTPHKNSDIIQQIVDEESRLTDEMLNLLASYDIDLPEELMDFQDGSYEKHSELYRMRDKVRGYRERFESLERDWNKFHLANLS